MKWTNTPTDSQDLSAQVAGGTVPDESAETASEQLITKQGSGEETSSSGVGT